MIKGILFDLDNTLVDFMKMKKISCEAAISAMIDAGLPLKKGEAMKILLTLYEKYGIENQQIFQIFLKETTGKIDYKILSAGIVAYRRVKTGFLEPYPHVIPTLLVLKTRGYKLGIVTDAPRLQAWIRLADMKIADFFDVVIALEDTGQQKPSIPPFREAVKKLDLAANEVLFVGDRPSRDVEGAKRLGMLTALAKYGESRTLTGKRIGAESSQRPDFELEDFSDLLEILGTPKR